MFSGHAVPRWVQLCCLFAVLTCDPVRDKEPAQMQRREKKLPGRERATGGGTASAAAETYDYECKRLNQGWQRCQKRLPDDVKRVVANQCDRLINNSSVPLKI